MIEILVLAFGLHVREFRLSQLQFEFAHALQGHIERIQRSERCVHLVTLGRMQTVQRRRLVVVSLGQTCTARIGGSL